VLPEFADVAALPAAARFGAGRLRGDVLGEALLDVMGDGGAGTEEVQTASQFVGQEGEVEGLAVREDAGQEIVGGLRPGGVVIAAGRLGSEAGLVGKPLMAQFIEAGATDQEAFGRGGGIELAGVEGFEDLLDIERRGATGELFLFILGRSVGQVGSGFKRGKFFAGGQGLRSLPTTQKRPKPCGLGPDG